MALIRNFPVPSDRMAIISTLLNIEDASEESVGIYR